MTIGVGSRVKVTEDRTLTETRGCYGTVIKFQKDFGQYGRLWRVKWTDEDTRGGGEYELDCYEHQLIEDGSSTSNWQPQATPSPWQPSQYVNTTPPELNNLEDKVISTVKGLINNYRVTKSQVADWLTGIAEKIKKS